jgi:hypothetical protein
MSLDYLYMIQHSEMAARTWYYIWKCVPLFVPSKHLTARGKVFLEWSISVPSKDGEAATVTCIHISTRHVSFSILIRRNSVAEWLIVVNTYHLNSDPKWPALLIPMSVWLWLQIVLHTNCGLCPPPSLRFMISLILSQKLWINSILQLFFTAALWILVI